MGLVRLDRRGLGDSESGDAPSGRADHAFLPHLRQGGSLRQNTVDRHVLKRLVELDLFVRVVATQRRPVESARDFHRRPVLGLHFLDAALPGASLNRLDEQLADLTVRFRVSGRINRLVYEHEVKVVRRRHALAQLLVVLRSWQDVVGKEAGRVDSKVDRDDHLQLRPQLLEEHVLTAAVAPQDVAACLKQHAGFRLLPRLGHEVVPPALVHRFLVVLVEGTLHRRIRPFLLVPALLVAKLVIPEEGRRDHTSHAPDAGASHLLEAVEHHLQRHRRVVLRQHAAHRNHLLLELARRLLAGLALG